MFFSKHYISIIIFIYVSTNFVFANDQTYVLGIGVGGASLSSNGELSFTSEEVKMGSHIYLDWYAFDSVGFGIESASLLNNAPSSCPESGEGYGSSSCELLSFDHQFAKLIWIFSGEKDYSRSGLKIGAGTSSLSYSSSASTFECVGGYYNDHCLEWGTTKLPTSKCTSDSGSASLVGIFYDWGADGFGARLGYDTISNQVGEITCSWRDTKIEGVSSTGGLGYLDLRWAF